MGTGLPKKFGEILIMPLSLPESQAINSLAELLYEFLPGTPHPYADQSISFAGVARQIGLGQYWSGGSKRPAITRLLELTLEYQRGKFCNLMLEIVRKGMIYRNNKGKPITREEINKVNDLIKRVNFKIPDLWNPTFLDGLPSKQPVSPIQEQMSTTILVHLRDELMRISQLSPQERGYAFEKFLNELFAVLGLSPRGAFKMVGEQIDGSFQIGTDIYLLEAKWQQKLVAQDELLIFRGKVESKSAWSRGMFISDSGFTEDGLHAYSRGRATNIIGMTGQDLFFILNGDISLVEAINRKARRASETGQFFISVFELLKQF
jgi:hypothetical protein